MGYRLKIASKYILEGYPITEVLMYSGVKSSTWYKYKNKEVLPDKRKSNRGRALTEFNYNDKGEIITLLHNDIIKLIPHRYPFLLIDKVTDIVINESITGIKSVTFNEPFFPGHFPEHPVMPGVLILESMAQSAACLVSYQDKSLSSNNLVFFTGIEKAKFRNPVTPGNDLILKINLISNKRSFYKFNGEAFIQNELVASADFSAMLVNEEKAK